jgi:hypothetical protein
MIQEEKSFVVFEGVLWFGLKISPKAHVLNAAVFRNVVLGR